MGEAENGADQALGRRVARVGMIMNMRLFGVMLFLLFPTIVMTMRQRTMVVLVGIPIGPMLPLITPSLRPRFVVPGLLLNLLVHQLPCHLHGAAGLLQPDTPPVP